MIPVRYCLKDDVQVHSGLPIFLENTQSKWIIVSGNTANTPEGSTDADPDGILTSIVGGESSKN